MKRWIFMLFTGVCLLCGCTKRNIVPDGSQNQYGDLPQPEGGIVWEQLWEDFDEVYTDLDIYPFAETVNANVNGDEKKLNFYLLLNTTISPEEAEQYATTVIKGFNDLIAEQNTSYAHSSENSYGGFVEQYEVYVMVGEDSTKDDESTWILEDTIPAGEYRPVTAQTEG